MALIKKIISCLRHPKKITNHIFYKYMNSYFCKRMDDITYIKKMYKHTFGCEINLENPKTINEKLQWLKLYNRHNVLTSMVDKYEAKKIVLEKNTTCKVAQTYLVCDKFEQINFNILPNEFVIKTTHDCGGVVICKNKKSFDFQKAKKIINNHLKRNYYLWCREWPYKNAKPRIIVEEFISDKVNSILPVYKFFCFNGNPYMIQVIQNDKQADETIDYYDVNWNKLQLRTNFPNSLIELEKPHALEEMVTICEKLSAGYPFIRVDLFTANNEIYFSEFTLFSDAGFVKYYPREWENKLGDMIILPNINKENK